LKPGFKNQYQTIFPQDVAQLNLQKGDEHNNNSLHTSFQKELSSGGQSSSFQNDSISQPGEAI
jgi:hypothetical protein